MPDLPPELEREIFELAFRQDPKNVPLKLTLCSVAHRVQTWIDLIFYEFVPIEKDHDAQRFLGLIDSNLKPPAFFSAVKILCLTLFVSATNALRILNACPGVEMLACWVNFRTQPEFPEFITLVKRLPLRRLSLELAHLLRLLLPTAGETSAGWLSNLTHLFIVVWNNNATEQISALRRLPHLTHLAAGLGPPYGLGAQHVALVCSTCPSLRVFVGLTDPMEMPLDFDPENLNEYRRVVVQTQPDESDLMPVWAAQSFVPDLWSRAEVIIGNRAAAGRPHFEE
ncbi:hypothetical protein C8R46DRAFT_1206077 [Mycena filopes]|nr:hypothetical protein C8R46DRAFT_1206077 [Mycena filopes]